MSKVAEIKERVRMLTLEERQAFRRWFAEFDAEAWDEEFASDAVSGKLDEAADHALREHASGQSTKL